MLPDAHAASWRDGGQPAERRVHLDEERAEVALHAVELGGEVADVARSRSPRVRSPVRSSAPSTASRISAEKCLFSFVQLRAKSVW